MTDSEGYIRIPSFGIEIHPDSLIELLREDDDPDSRPREVTYSVESLTHFRCQVCTKWWSIGDPPKRDFWFCPWCGEKLVLKDKQRN